MLWDVCDWPVHARCRGSPPSPFPTFIRPLVEIARPCPIPSHHIPYRPFARPLIEKAIMCQLFDEPPILRSTFCDARRGNFTCPQANRRLGNIHQRWEDVCVLGGWVGRCGWVRVSVRSHRHTVAGFGTAEAQEGATMEAGGGGKRIVEERGALLTHWRRPAALFTRHHRDFFLRQPQRPSAKLPYFISPVRFTESRCHCASFFPATSFPRGSFGRRRFGERRYGECW